MAGAAPNPVTGAAPNPVAGAAPNPVAGAAPNELNADGAVKLPNGFGAAVAPAAAVPGNAEPKDEVKAACCVTAAAAAAVAAAFMFALSNSSAFNFLDINLSLAASARSAAANGSDPWWLPPYRLPSSLQYICKYEALMSFACR